MWRWRRFALRTLSLRKLSLSPKLLALLPTQCPVGVRFFALQGLMILFSHIDRALPASPSLCSRRKEANLSSRPSSIARVAARVTFEGSLSPSGLRSFRCSKNAKCHPRALGVRTGRRQRHSTSQSPRLETEFRVLDLKTLNPVGWPAAESNDFGVFWEVGLKSCIGMSFYVPRFRVCIACPSTQN